MAEKKTNRGNMFAQQVRADRQSIIGRIHDQLFPETPLPPSFALNSPFNIAQHSA